MGRLNRNKTAESANKRLEQRFINSKTINEGFEPSMTEEEAKPEPKAVVRFIDKIKNQQSLQQLIKQLNTKVKRIYGLMAMVDILGLEENEINLAVKELKSLKQSMGDETQGGGELAEGMGWTPDIQNDFDRWKADGNVTQNTDGTYSTQDAQWRNRLKDLEALKQYFTKEFLNENLITEDIADDILIRYNIMSLVGKIVDENPNIDISLIPEIFRRIGDKIESKSTINKPQGIGR